MSLRSFVREALLFGWFFDFFKSRPEHKSGYNYDYRRYNPDDDDPYLLCDDDDYCDCDIEDDW